MDLVIDPAGEVRCLYDEKIPLASLGELSIRRASQVEPDEQGRWRADLSPAGGPLLGPFAQRSVALAAEARWLLEHRLLPLKVTQTNSERRNFMGLTHYWRRSCYLEPVAFARAAGDCQKIMAQLGIPLADWAGPAVFSEDLISFGGVAPLNCELFVVSRGDRQSIKRPREFSFTKTDRLPFDLCVRVALIILRHHLGYVIRVYSDDSDWSLAIDRCQEHLGYGREFRLDQ